MPIQQIFLGGGGSAKTYVEDVFSIDLWNGNYDTTPAPININNGIDLSASGRGGLVWTKSRTINANSHQLFDTERGVSYAPDWGGPLYSNLPSGTATNAVFSSFNSNGFSLTAGDAASDPLNGDSDCDYVAWTFGKQKGFFDMVKYEGNNNVAQSINHNLGCVPGCIIVKNTSVGTENWAVYHKNLSSNYEGLRLNTTAGEDGADWWNSTSPTSTQFTVGTVDNTNKDTDDYIAYLFADGDDTDAQIFGDGENESIIKCGTYEGNSGNNDINCGWEPQWVLIKNIEPTDTTHWRMYDNMRAWTGVGGDSSSPLRPNTNDLDDTTQTWFDIHLYPKGFEFVGENDDGHNESGKTYIYIAIRRGPMKTPTDATKVFAIDTFGGTAPTPPQYTSGFPVDMEISANISSAAADEDRYHSARLLNKTYMKANTVDAQIAESTRNWDYMDGLGSQTGTLSQYQSWMLRRAPGFFDVVCYKGTNIQTNINHNLGVKPEMMWIKRTTTTGGMWVVYNEYLAGTDGTQYMYLHTDGQEQTSSNYWGDTPPDDLIFTVGNDSGGNTDVCGKDGSNVPYNYVAYLFASCPGVSKLGTYTGTGEVLNIDCEFASSARFVMIKRRNASGNWCLFDTLRGIGVGNDPRLIINDDVAPDITHNYVHTYNSGFSVVATGTGSGGNDTNALNSTYIYFAIA